MRSSRSATPRDSTDLSLGAAQERVDAYVKSLDSADGPVLFSWPIFQEWVISSSRAEPLGSAFAETYGSVADRLRRAACGGPLYIADGHAWTRPALELEFPELRLFKVRVSDMFAESARAPGLWVESERFAALRSLSRMRRELRSTGLAEGLKTVDVVRALLGLGSPKPEAPVAV